MRPITLVLTVALAAAPPAALAAPPARAPSAETDASLGCAAAFAVAATEQRRGERAALALPPLAVRGKEYFVRVSAKAMDETGLNREQVRALLGAHVAKLQAGAANDPDGAMTAVVTPCLARLDAEVPPLPRPSLAQCTAMLSLAYEEVHAREGLSASARDLKTLAAVLESRQREVLTAEGVTGNAADRRLAETHDAMLKEALETPAGVEKYDLQTCYELAKPKEGGHY